MVSSPLASPIRTLALATAGGRRRRITRSRLAPPPGQSRWCGHRVERHAHVVAHKGPRLGQCPLAAIASAGALPEI